MAMKPDEAKGHPSQILEVKSDGELRPAVVERKSLGLQRQSACIHGFSMWVEVVRISVGKRVHTLTTSVSTSHVVINSLCRRRRC